MRKENIRNLNDDDLIIQAKAAVGIEAQSTQDVLLFLAEIERRYLFAKRGCDSLFTFCRKVLNYSEGHANRRISAMRLIRDIPEAKESLSSGAVNLSTLCQLKSFITQEEKTKNIKLKATTKVELLKTIENKSQAECAEVFVALSPDSAAKVIEKMRLVTPDLKELKIPVTTKLDFMMTELHGLLAHQNMSHTHAELLEIVCSMALKILKKAPKSNAKDHEDAAAAVTQEKSDTKVSLKLHPEEPSYAENCRRVRYRANFQCEYRDPLTKTKCLSRYRTQIDHVVPRAVWPKDKPGLNSLSNLRLYCQTHNNLAAIQLFSTKHMSKYLPQLRE